jgi:nucleoside-diphosphate-sugar epimerase
MQHLQIFQKEHDIVLPIVPYRNFDNSLDLNQVIMQSEFQDSYNIGSGSSHKVSEVSNIIANLFGFENQIVFRGFQDKLASRRVMNVDRMRRTGWAPTISLSDGISETVSNFFSRLKENK